VFPLFTNTDLIVFCNTILIYSLFFCKEDFQIGRYSIKTKITITKNENPKSNPLRKLYSKEKIVVEKVMYLNEYLLVRGRIAQGGWITLFDITNEVEYVDKKVNLF
jgi:hypothetical protein